MELANSTQLSLNEVYRISATAEAGVFMVRCNITDMNGDTYDCEYTSRPDDPHGLNPKIRLWLADNSDFPIQPYVPPTDEDIRATMPRLTARQFRLGLVNSGLTPVQVTAAIESMPEGAEKESALIEWEYATIFDRTHPLISTVGIALGLPDEQIDAMWRAAISL